MSPSLAEQKAAVRLQMRETLSKLSANRRSSDSATLCERLIGLRAWEEARHILFYAPMTDEVDIWPLLARALAAGKLPALPRYLEAEQHYEAVQVTGEPHDIVSGRYGIREPAPHCPRLPLNHLDLILVPGVAFDLIGRRLGRGKGYYDRLLAQVRGIKCGLAFDVQVLGQLPSEPHDIHLDCLLTPTRWWESSPRAELE